MNGLVEKVEGNNHRIFKQFKGDITSLIKQNSMSELGEEEDSLLSIT